MTSVDSNFNFLCGRPPEPDPLRVDVINGWHLMAADSGNRDPDSDAMLQLIKFGLHCIYHILIQSLRNFVVSANKNTNNPFSYFLHVNNNYCYQAAAV